MRGRRRTSEDGHKISNLEAQHRFQDAAASIDKGFDEALSRINWKRRLEAEKSLVTWTNTYMIGLLLDDPPPPKGEEILLQMQKAITDHNNYMICMSRGSGKSSYTEITTLYAMCSGLQKFTVIISNNARAATGMMQDMWRPISETDTAFAQDYPEVCFPFQVTKGSFRRRQTYRGKSTEIQKNSGNIVFPRLFKDDGTEFPTSGSVIAVRGVSSGLRGMKKGTMRPTLVLLDDLQSSETAENPEAVEKLMNIIKKDICCLGGKERLSILQTATPIMPDDLVDKIKSDPNWHTQMFPGIISYPRNMKLWDEYFKKYDAENVSGQKHTESLKFYRDNKDEMDFGSEVFNPKRFSKKDGHISAIQKLLEMKHIIGNAAFQAEYQMQPTKQVFSLDISPKIVVGKVNTYNELEVPSGFVFVAAATDLNVSYGMTTTITAFKPDMTSVVIYHNIKLVSIDGKLNDTEYNQIVYNKLCELGRQIKDLNVRIDGWAIDAGGRNWDTVCQFAKNAQQLVGLTACAFAGRSSNMFNPYVRTRLRDSIGRTVLCGNSDEHVKSGSGQKYMFFDADFHKELAQRAFLSEVGAPGSCSLYSGDTDEHSDFAIQFCNEKLRFIKKGSDGKNHYTWASKEPHDYLDCMSMCFAVASSQGISGTNIRTGLNAPSGRMKFRQKRKIVVV